MVVAGAGKEGPDFSWDYGAGEGDGGSPETGTHLEAICLA